MISRPRWINHHHPVANFKSSNKKRSQGFYNNGHTNFLKKIPANVCYNPKKRQKGILRDPVNTPASRFRMTVGYLILGNV